MSTAAEDRLYRLLPALYRIQDAEGDRYALRALLALFQDEVDALEDNIDGLYENWFIETCAPWVVPYIGDLLGVQGVHRVTRQTASRRAFVANTLAYRRRKGTAAMLEQLARDVTGHAARVVEFFQLLATTQHLNHLRPGNLGMVNLRDASALDTLHTPFETMSHTGEVRSIRRERGRYNIPNIGLYLWRLQAYPLENAVARQIQAGRYTFNPFGRDASLFNSPETESEITHIAEAINLPVRLRRRALFDELAAYQARADARDLQFFDPARPAFEVFVLRASSDEAYEQVTLDNLRICNLRTWRRPEAAPPDAEGFRPMRAMVDPVLGRLTFPEATEPVRVQVNYACGFSDDLGGGPYDREESVDEMLASALDLEAADEARTSARIDWQIGVRQDAVGEENVVPTLTEAVQAWNAQPPGTVGVITVMDSSFYEENIDGAERLLIPEGSVLLILAADWPLTVYPDRPAERIVGQWDATGLRPLLLGDLSVRGTAGGGSTDPGTLLLNGLSMEGELRVLEGNLGRLHLRHGTLIADRESEEVRPSVLEVNSSVDVLTQNTWLRVTVEDSICGPINLPDTVPSLLVRSSIIDTGPREMLNVDAEEEAEAGIEEQAIYAPGTAVEIEKSTLFGQTTCYRLEADDSIFTDLLHVERRQVGCIRFSYVPPGSRTPQRYRCQPDQAVQIRIERAEREAKAKGEVLPPEVTQTLQAQVEAAVKPHFTSDDFGSPGYAQLRRSTPLELRTGAEGGREMGVFYSLFLPQREENLRVSMQEYLRFGLEAGLFFVT